VNRAELNRKRPLRSRLSPESEQVAISDGEAPPVGVSLSQLESHLWEAANILRGPVDAPDFKTYVLALLFLKRLSDVQDEEYRAALPEAGGDEEYARLPQNNRFQVREDYHWHALHILFPDLHPNNALNHGDAVDVCEDSQLPLTALEFLARRYARTGWPVGHPPTSAN